MKRAPVNRRRRGAKIALALTWDGARWPVRVAAAQSARAFLGGEGLARRLRGARWPRLFAADACQAKMRICWVPRLKGGDNVLADPFVHRRMAGASLSRVEDDAFGDVLGVVYRTGCASRQTGDG